jgi:bifunctional DNA-binding transcriptional regulator/antitoxin component of YhaV-PrlF toxin-antitoxin module
MPKSKNNSIRKITRIAKGSLGVILPAEILRALGWRERQRVLVKRMSRGILIRDAITKHRK